MIDKSLTALLGLHDFNVVGHQENATSFKYIVDPKETFMTCPNENCASPSTDHEHKSRDPKEYRDLPVKGKFTAIEVNRIRYRCKKCGRTFFPTYSGLSENFSMTQRFYDSIVRQVNTGHTFTDVANTNGIDIDIVRRVFLEWCNKKIAEYHVIAPKHLGIDESHLAGKLRGTIVDIDEAIILDMGKDRTNATIRELLSRVEHPENIEAVTMDMTGGYKNLCEEFFPEATIIIDRYHIFQHLEEKIATVYSTLIKQVRAHIKAIEDPAERARENQKLKETGTSVNPFKKKRENLTRTDKEKIAAIIKYDSRFAKIVKINYEFREALKADQTKIEAELSYKAWSDSLPSDPDFKPFKDFRDMIDRWYVYIFNYYDYHLSNATTEQLNGVAKQINRAGRGYSFEVIRYRMLFREKPKPKPSRYGFDPSEVIMAYATPGMFQHDDKPELLHQGLSMNDEDVLEVVLELMRERDSESFQMIADDNGQFRLF